MRFYTIHPSSLVIRNDAEFISLQKILKKMGLTLTPLSKTESIDLWTNQKDDEDSQDTEPYSSEGESSDELSHN